MKFLQLGFFPRSADCALLLLRLWFGLVLFFNHGLPKVTHFSEMAGHFPDPLDIGPKASLILAAFAEAVCSVLVAIGFGTRLAALIIAAELGIAFFRVHHHVMAGAHSGELAFLYVGAALAIVFAGPGRYSADGA